MEVIYESTKDNTIIEFARDYAIWLGLAGVVMLIAFIGYMFDSKNKKAKKNNQEQPLGEPDVVITSENMNEVVPGATLANEQVAQVNEVAANPAVETTGLDVNAPTSIVEPVMPISDLNVPPVTDETLQASPFETVVEVDSVLNPSVESVPTAEVLNMTPEVSTVIEPTASVVEPIVEPAAPVVEPVVESVAPIVEPVVEPIVEPVAPIVEPLVEPEAPAIDPYIAEPAKTLENSSDYAYTPPANDLAQPVMQPEPQPVEDFSYTPPTPEVVQPQPVSDNLSPEVNAFAFEPNNNNKNL